MIHPIHMQLHYNNHTYELKRYNDGEIECKIKDKDGYTKEGRLGGFADLYQAAQWAVETIDQYNNHINAMRM